MNDPITLAATDYEEPRGLPDTTDVRHPVPDTDALASGPEPESGTAPAAQAGTQAPRPEAGSQTRPEARPEVEYEAGPEARPEVEYEAGTQARPGAGYRAGPPAGPQAGPEAVAAPGQDPALRPAAAPARTLLETAATGRSVQELADLVSLLKDSGQVPNPGHTALRAAAVARPVHEVREMVTLLGEPPHEVVETDITLRAAALGRPIEDVALLVSILGSGEQPAYGHPEPAERVRTAAHPPAPQAPAPAQAPARGPARSWSGSLRHILRWPVALALLLCGALHVPGDLAGLTSGTPGGLVALAVTLLCLTAGALLAVRDTAGAWRAAAVVALGVAVLHVVGGVAGFDPLGGAVGGSVEWAGTTVMLSAAAGAVLAGLALQYRPAAEPADGA
ncbi:hypothetical protein [Streptomyces sp. H34-S4]|uniref:hypothetical protein n=1 Tax=Streptomyces sp. H34-S4 TaxID=2996463 RepID=UPI00226D9036|nr:hypothetical protein [Streptomyces sp. H34-S4]MCY0939618.1 hypothetical protein [Streptomyces sp. H34-S4]